MADKHDDVAKLLNEIAWRDFVMFAWGQEDAHAAFRGATGRPQRPRRGAPLDAMIDKACGVSEDDEYMAAFVRWVTENHWGAEFAPAAMVAEKRRTEATVADETKRCPRCDGQRGDPEDVECWECKGNGTIYRPNMRCVVHKNCSVMITCPACHGSGKEGGAP